MGKKHSVKKEVRPQELAGFRKGVKQKTDVLKNITDDEKKHLQLRRELNEDYVVDDDAYQIGIRCDQMYLQFLELQSITTAHLTKMLDLKRTIDVNKTDILSGVTDKKTSTGHQLTVRDLEISNIEIKRQIEDNKRLLWGYMASMFKYVDCPRIDNYVFFSTADWKKFVDDIKQQLTKSGLTLYDLEQ